MKPRWRKLLAVALAMAAGCAVARGADVSAALAPGVPLEDRRYLLYLYARIGDLGVAEKLAEKILADNPSDKQTLLVMASLYVEKQEAEKALRNAKILRSYFPDDDQALYFLGASYYLAGQYQEANEILRELKLTHFEGRLYPYQTDLASSAYQAGDWFRSMQAYQELLREHNLSDELRQKARTVLERIYYEHLPQVELEEAGQLLDVGTIWRTALDYRMHVTDRHRVFTRWDREDTKLDARPSLREFAGASHQAVAGLQSALDRRFESTIFAGASEEGAVGGASLTHHFGQQRYARLELLGNARALDGLLIEALDGRQHKVTLSGSYLLTQDWLAYWDVYGRAVTLDGTELGTGYGMNFNLEHIFMHEVPDFRVGYRAAWSRFSQSASDVSLVDRVASPLASFAEREALLSNVELREYHRHGVYGIWRDQLSGWLYYHAAAGADWNVERASLEYNALAGFSVYPRKSLEIRAEAGYFSSARTADQGSEVWQLNGAIKYWF